MNDNGDPENDYNVDSAGHDDIADEDTLEEEEHFDITLAASHSYMGPGLVAVGGRSVLEAGWRGKIPVAAHHGVVFPGETLPMLVTQPHEAALLEQTIQQDKLFGLLCSDASGLLASGYGALCEVFEAAGGGGAGGALSLKARAIHRFRLADAPRRPTPLALFSRIRPLEVEVLGEWAREAPLRQTRLASLDRLRRGCARLDARLRRLDAALTPWPPFVYDMLDFGRLRRFVADYFRLLGFERLPEEPVALSFWVAANLALAPPDRLALFAADDALQRLHMAVRFIERLLRNCVLACAGCGAEVARAHHLRAMSSDGLHANYTNPGGHLHDILTVSEASNLEASGAPSAEYSWFPGYTWLIMRCRGCSDHLGWRFEATRRSLRPQRFFGLCRGQLQPRADPPPPP